MSALAAAERGYEYVSINDHSRHVTVAHGLDERRLLAQIDTIDELNAHLSGITVLRSVEVDILEDGTLDLPNRVLKKLDFTVCSVHYQFGLSAEKQTEGILRAMASPQFCPTVAPALPIKPPPKEPLRASPKCLRNGKLAALLFPFSAS